MKFDRDDKNIICDIVEQQLEDFLGVKDCLKGKKTDFSKKITLFLQIAADNGVTNKDIARQIFESYIVNCMKSFRAWKEASSNNWIGFVGSSGRMKEYIVKHNSKHFISIAGKEGESSWTF